MSNRWNVVSMEPMGFVFCHMWCRTTITNENMHLATPSSRRTRLYRSQFQYQSLLDQRTMPKRWNVESMEPMEFVFGHMW